MRPRESLWGAGLSRGGTGADTGLRIPVAAVQRMGTEQASKVKGDGGEKSTGKQLQQEELQSGWIKRASRIC